jgi:nitroreductase
MEVFEAIRTLLAVRNYRDTPVPDAVVRRVVEAGRLTGSGMNRQPRTRALLGIPASLDVLAILPFGYPARAVGRGKKQRKSLQDVAHLERYGRPFE